MWTEQKDIDSRLLKAVGAQPVRALFAAGLRARRRVRFVDRDIAELDATLGRDGLLEIPSYLPADRFVALRAEVQRLVDRKRLREDEIAGAIYQRVNLFELDDLSSYPELSSFAHDPLIHRLAQANQGQRLTFEDLVPHVHRVRNVPGAHDQNQDAHTDTFHATTKGWLYLHDVGVDDGCFWYARGSHRLTARRLRFEYVKSLRGRGGGSWRIDPGDEEQLGISLAPVPVRANTLVIANTCGFHRRGEAATDAFRDTVHFSARVSPFRG